MGLQSGRAHPSSPIMFPSLFRPPSSPHQALPPVPSPVPEEWRDGGQGLGETVHLRYCFPLAPALQCDLGQDGQGLELQAPLFHVSRT